MYGLSEAYFGKTMIQITLGQLGLAVTLAALVHVAVISLMTLEFSRIKVSSPEIIYLKLIAEGDGAALSASEPSMESATAITLPAIVAQADPVNDLLAGTVPHRLQEIAKQNTLIMGIVPNTNSATPKKVAPVDPPHRFLAEAINEPGPLGETKLMLALITATGNLSIVQTLPTPSLMPRPEPAAPQSIKSLALTTNSASPKQPAPLGPPRQILAEHINEPRSSGEAKLTPPLKTATRNLSIVQTLPTPSLMPRPEPAARQIIKRLTLTAGERIQIEPTQLSAPAQAPTPSELYWPESDENPKSLLVFTISTSAQIPTRPAPLKIVPPLASVDEPKTESIHIEGIERQNQIATATGPIELALYQSRPSPTIAEPTDMDRSILATPATSPRVPTSAKVPPEEPPPDPFASVLQKIAELEKKQIDRQVSQTDIVRTKSASINQVMVKASAFEGASGTPLDSEISKLINSQITANWRLPPGSLDADLKPVLLRVLLNRNGVILLIEYLDKVEETNERYRALAESAYRAVSKTKTLIGLPGNEFEKWRELRLNFHLGG